MLQREQSQETNRARWLESRASKAVIEEASVVVLADVAEADSVEAVEVSEIEAAVRQFYLNI